MGSLWVMAGSDMRQLLLARLRESARSHRTARRVNPTPIQKQRMEAKPHAHTPELGPPWWQLPRACKLSRSPSGNVEPGWLGATQSLRRRPGQGEVGAGPAGLCGYEGGSTPNGDTGTQDPEQTLQWPAPQPTQGSKQ